ncbi:MAG: acyl carrier protein [Actinocatenispora sp.]
METHDPEAERVLARLESMLTEVWDQRPTGVPVDSDASLLSLGVDSLTLVLLLDKVEAEFRVDWDTSAPPGAFSSLRSIANFVAERNSDGTTGHELRSGEPA